jgi:hypothetical protein
VALAACLRAAAWAAWISKKSLLSQDNNGRGANRALFVSDEHDL